MPLSSVGFLLGAASFTVFAATFYSITKTTAKSLQSFAFAYLCLAFAFFIWGLASGLSLNLLIPSVIAGNILLLLGSVLLLNIELEFLGENKKWALGLAGVLALLFVWMRITYFPPAPSLQGGILVFNTQTPVAIIFGLIILAIWLPTSIKVGQIIAEAVKVSNLSFIYSAIYTMAAAATIVFIAARTTQTITLSFIIIVISYAMLLVSNIITSIIIKKNLPESAVSSSEQAPKYTANNIIALIFVILILIEWFWPRSYCSRSAPCTTDLVDLLIWPTMIFGIVAGGSFFNRINKLTKNSDKLIRVLGLLVGTLGVFFMIFVGFLSGLTGSFRGRPTI